jgi:hypothetical protein
MNYFARDPLQTIWLVGSFMVWAVLLFDGFVRSRPTALNPQRLSRLARLGSSAALVSAAWSLFWLARTSELGGYSALIAVGMTLDFIGDSLLAGLIRSSTPDQATLGGIALFGLGHVAYIAALLLFASIEQLVDTGRLVTTTAIWFGIGVGGWYVAVFRGRQTDRLTAQQIAALPYALLLAIVAGLASGLALQDVRFVGLAVGTALFVISDLILAGELFKTWTFAGIHDVVWLTYGPAQALIVGTAAIALAISRT